MIRCRVMRLSTAFFKRHSTMLTALALSVGFFLVQFFFINDYGVSWDEPLHRNWGKIFYIFLRTGERRFLEVMPGHGIHYGPVYYFINYLLSEKIFLLHLLSFVASNHVLNILVSSGAVGLLFLLAYALGGRRIAFLSVLFLVFFPPFIAHAHYNPKDIPLMTAVLLTSLTFVHAFRTSRRNLFCLTGFLFGVCIALKVSALLMLPAFGMSYLLWCFSAEKTAASRKQALVTMLLTILAIMIGTIAAWPSAWGDLMLIPRSIFFFARDFWPGKVLFLGTEYAGANLPWYYTPLEYFMVMPLITIVAFLIGSFCMIRNIRRTNPGATFLFLVLWILVPIVFSLKPNLVRYDGMRQFFFCLPAIAMAAAFGCDAFLKFVERSMRKPFLWLCVFLSIVSVSLLYEVIIVHPFEGSYRNELVRAFIPSDLDHTFQIEYWGPTYKQGMDWLRKNADHNPVICVPTAGILATWYVWREDFTFECSEKSNYIMFFTRYSEAGQYALLPMEPVFTIERMNSLLLKIYKVK